MNDGADDRVIREERANDLFVVDCVKQRTTQMDIGGGFDIIADGQEEEA